MPPKKKRRAPAVKAGIARQHLIDNFATLPSAGEDILNGHVWFLYTEHDRVISHILTALKDVVPEDPSSYRYQVQKLCKTLEKFRHLTGGTEFVKFVALCCEVFTPVGPVPSISAESAPSTSVEPAPSMSTEPIPSMSTEPELSSLAGSAPSTSAGPGPFEPASPTADQPLASPRPRKLSLRKGFSSPRRERIKRRLDFVSKGKAEMQKKYLMKLKEMKAKQQKTETVKRLNHVIKRKDATIQKLKLKLVDDSVHQDLIATKSELAVLKRKHRRLKLYRQCKRASTPASVDEDVARLHRELRSKDAVIRHLENRILLLEETIEELQCRTPGPLQKEGKTFPPETRMFVYDAIVNHVPTRSVPTLLSKFAQRSGLKMDSVPHRTTVEMMARELGVVADLQAAELLMTNANVTLGFDSTTQEGVHINSVHITTKDGCNVIAIDQLAGGTAEDYARHVDDSVKRLAEVYAAIHVKAEFEACRKQMIANIVNTMTDRAAVNHATIVRVCEMWGKPLNELNCHLHPLDTIASATRSALRGLESDKGKLFGSDCIAANVVLQMNKFRYKDGKGDPRGFTNFLDHEGLPRGLIPRYRGNRLHILFHICGKYVEHHDRFVHFLRTGTVSCGGLQTSILGDFDSDVGKDEMRVLGLIGKLLSGPWMTMFYTSPEEQVSHTEGITIVKGVLETVKEYLAKPECVLTTKTDFFGKVLDENDTTLQKLQESPENETVFVKMVKVCLTAVITVLERQYDRYFAMDINQKLEEETESARCHNIDAEEIMGMFSATKDNAPNATLNYLSSKIRAQKNGVVDYLDNLEQDKRTRVIQMSRTIGRKQLQASRRKSVQVREELAQRIALKQEMKATAERKKLEKLLRSTSLDIGTEFPDLPESVRSDLMGILGGKVVGRAICHVWYNRESKQKEMFSGKVEKLKKKAGGTYVIGYWSQDETYDDAVDFEVSKYELAADLVCGDLVFP